MDLANLSIAVLVFGQLVESKINLFSLIFGGIIYIVLLGISLKVLSKKYETR